MQLYFLERLSRSPLWLNLDLKPNKALSNLQLLYDMPLYIFALGGASIFYVACVVEQLAVLPACAGHKLSTSH